MILGFSVSSPQFRFTAGWTVCFPLVYCHCQNLKKNPIHTNLTIISIYRVLFNNCKADYIRLKTRHPNGRAVFSPTFCWHILKNCNKLKCIIWYRCLNTLLLWCLFRLQPSLPVLYTLSSQATHEAVHLLCRMLVFDPVSHSVRNSFALCFVNDCEPFSESLKYNYGYVVSNAVDTVITTLNGGGFLVHCVYTCASV